MLEKNVGGLDRTLRFLVGGLLLAVAARTGRKRPFSFAALVVGVGLLVSVVTRRCTVNALLGINTCPTHE
ncbi:DUF2892 domain-containing protein [Natronorubrum sp. A-ect3]|uniref:YgaP family membrane protein n=1 Tax=Natronorubrum sp. A-ect3 TaxID=3242698 RepID=UPI00359E8819